VWTLLGLWKTWAFGIVLGLTVFVVSFILISRRFGKKIQPIFEQVQKQIQAGKMQLALKTLEDLLAMSRWQIMLKGQINAQIGSLAFTMGDERKALDYLSKSSPRVADARLFLASIYYRRKDFDKAGEVLETAIRYNKKQVLLYNVYAYILNKRGKKDEAIEQLLRCLKVEKDNESTKDNLLRLQNNKKMNMKRFGMTWYSLQLEKLPVSMRQSQGMGQAGLRQRKRGRKR
jgi:tetratricopeptide (TPR) repeat protein